MYWYTSVTGPGPPSGQAEIAAVTMSAVCSSSGATPWKPPSTGQDSGGRKLSSAGGTDSAPALAGAATPGISRSAASQIRTGERPNNDIAAFLASQGASAVRAARAAQPSV